MDPFKLLSRSTKLSKASSTRQKRLLPSNGPVSSSQPCEAETGHGPAVGESRKRKRGPEPINDVYPDFFGTTVAETARQGGVSQASKTANVKTHVEAAVEIGSILPDSNSSHTTDDENRAILSAHKLKFTWLNPQSSSQSDRRTPKSKSKPEKVKPVPLYPSPVQNFSQLSSRYMIAPRLAENLNQEGYVTPTEVQMGALPILMDKDSRGLLPALSSKSSSRSFDVDLLSVAPTGSGKTLAFLLPLIHRLMQHRRGSGRSGKVSAIILAPTRELAGQIANEGRKLAQNTGIKVTLTQKGMQLTSATEQKDGPKSAPDENGASSAVTLVKSDVLVSTPGILATIIHDTCSADPRALANIHHLILDEADVLLDPLFRQQTLAIWNGLENPNLRVSLWSATMGSNIEELAKSVLADRRKNLRSEEPPKVTEPPLIRLVVGLKDSAVPNVHHRLVYAASEQGKLMGLRQLLHPASKDADDNPGLLPPFLVFTQTIERAVALHSELLYDIPAEAGGIGRIAVLHSDLSDSARDGVMTRFRKGEIWVLITTDLLSRGVDFRGVNGVVNYDMPTSSAAYVHRVGRTGRAGREGGVAVTLYSKDDIPYLKQIANVIAIADRQRGSTDSAGAQQWLLDALPSLSKQTKQKLKKRGVESRTARGMEKDPKAAKKTRISTKPGFIRQQENRRKGAIRGSQARREDSDSGGETDFGGFD